MDQAFCSDQLSTIGQSINNLLSSRKVYYMTTYEPLSIEESLPWLTFRGLSIGKELGFHGVLCVVHSHAQVTRVFERRKIQPCIPRRLQASWEQRKVVCSEGVFIGGVWQGPLVIHADLHYAPLQYLVPHFDWRCYLKSDREVFEVPPRLLSAFQNLEGSRSLSQNFNRQFYKSTNCTW